MFNENKRAISLGEACNGYTVRMQPPNTNAELPLYAINGNGIQYDSSCIGSPPSYIDAFKTFITRRYGMEVMKLQRRWYLIGHGCIFQILNDDAVSVQMASERFVLEPIIVTFVTDHDLSYYRFLMQYQGRSPELDVYRMYVSEDLDQSNSPRWKGARYLWRKYIKERTSGMNVKTVNMRDRLYPKLKLPSFSEEERDALSRFILGSRM